MYAVKLETASLYTRDGIRLDADIYRPESQETFPVLLMRQPYGRKIASTVVYAHPQWYAAQGYIVVIQDVRGRGTSQGEFDLFINEIDDGLDTLHWAKQLAGSNGSIGMYGFSYQGMTQLYAASHCLDALKTICPAMIAYDLYSDWAYENGAFCLQGNLSWAMQLAAETSRLQGDSMAFQKLYAASRQLPLNDSIPANPNLLRELAPDSFYHDWLNHPYPDSYWQQLSPKFWLSKVDLPMLHIGGWFDPYLRGTLNLYKTMKGHSVFPQHLMIGPWGHLPWGRKVGELDYGKTSISFIDQLQIQWFDYFLKGKSSDFLQKPSICVFEMGSNQWRYLSHFPTETNRQYFLKSVGLSNLTESGKLQAAQPEETTPTEDIIVHDPWRPVPSLGGHAATPAGVFDRSLLESRNDILTYTSEPIAEDMYLMGESSVTLYCTADALSFDLSVVLSQVTPEGKVYGISQGYGRIDHTQLPICLPLQATCLKVPQGNCLRLSISAACFPAYAVNSGTGSLPKDSKLIESKIITLKVMTGKEYLSSVSLGEILHLV
ncbi:MAG: CocE/NonD family hydrolase [Microcystaceae cyanobacterium]